MALPLCGPRISRRYPVDFVGSGPRLGLWFSFFSPLPPPGARSRRGASRGYAAPRPCPRPWDCEAAAPGPKCPPGGAGRGGARAAPPPWPGPCRRRRHLCCRYCCCCCLGQPRGPGSPPASAPPTTSTTSTASTAPCRSPSTACPSSPAAGTVSGAADTGRPAGSRGLPCARPWPPRAAPQPVSAEARPLGPAGPHPLTYHLRFPASQPHPRLSITIPPPRPFIILISVFITFIPRLTFTSESLSLVCYHPPV